MPFQQASYSEKPNAEASVLQTLYNSCEPSMGHCTLKSPPLSLLLLYCNVTIREKFVFDEEYKHRPTVIPLDEICEFVCLLHGFESYSGEHIVTNTTEYRCSNAFFMMINAIDPVPSNSSA